MLNCGNIIYDNAFVLTGCSNFKSTFLMLWSFFTGNVGISLHKKEIQHISYIKEFTF